MIIPNIKSWNQYIETSDIITNWVNAELQVCELHEEFATMDDMYDWFKEWCSREGLPKKNIPLKKKVKDSLIFKQEKCRHGAKWGKTQRNNTKSSPLFTYKLIT